MNLCGPQTNVLERMFGFHFNFFDGDMSFPAFQLIWIQSFVVIVVQ